jgi:fructose-1,6-bisphosphatase/inositol monophosphatase family enzyme
MEGRVELILAFLRDMRPWAIAAGVLLVACAVAIIVLWK